MAIIKTATNITVNIKGNYTLHAKQKINKQAEKVTIVATDGDIHLISSKTIQVHGSTKC
jgi:hypothetical protein